MRLITLFCSLIKRLFEGLDSLEVFLFFQFEYQNNIKMNRDVREISDYHLLHEKQWKLLIAWFRIFDFLYSSQTELLKLFFQKIKGMVEDPKFLERSSSLDHIMVPNFKSKSTSFVSI